MSKNMGPQGRWTRTGNMWKAVQKGMTVEPEEVGPHSSISTSDTVTLSKSKSR